MQVSSVSPDTPNFEIGERGGRLNTEEELSTISSTQQSRTKSYKQIFKVQSGMKAKENSFQEQSGLKVNKNFELGERGKTTYGQIVFSDKLSNSRSGQHCTSNFQQIIRDAFEKEILQRAVRVECKKEAVKMERGGQRNAEE